MCLAVIFVNEFVGFWFDGIKLKVLQGAMLVIAIKRVVKTKL